MVDIVVDVESDGPVPGLFSMISIGIVVAEEKLITELLPFKALFKPISLYWKHDALAISNISREEHEAYPEALDSTVQMLHWLENIQKVTGGGRLTMWSDNPAYDFMWPTYYLHHYVGQSPLGWSARRIGDLWCGHKGSLKARWKHLRDTPHTHDPVDDAMGNAEALIKIKRILSTK